MAPPTRPRGAGDTVARRRLERPFALALAAALLLHAPLVPTRFFDWIHLFFGGVTDYDDADAEAIIPIDLDLQGQDPGATPRLDPPPAPVPPKPTPLTEGVPDAGAPHDGGVPARPSEPEPVPPPVVDAGPPPLPDPVRAAGGAGTIAAKDPNVQMLFNGIVLRRFPLGAWAAGLLVNVPEWRAFFEGSPVDPIRDLNHLLITAPRFKGDTSKLVAVMELAISADLTRKAVDGLLLRTGGEWLDGVPVPTARARVLDAERLFALVPQRHLLVVLPEEAKDQLDRLRTAKGFKRSTEGVVVSMVTPARPFKRFFPLPETLEWLRLALTPTADGGADLALEAGDRSPADARLHAPVLSREIEARRTIELLGFSVAVVDPVTFSTAGKVIRARAHVTPGQLQGIMSWVEQGARALYDGGSPTGH